MQYFLYLYLNKKNNSMIPYMNNTNNTYLNNLLKNIYTFICLIVYILVWLP